MDYKKLLKTEILFKICSKFIGLGKSLLLLGLFGFSKQLDSHYLAISLIGIVLSIPVIFELLYMSNVKKYIETDNLDATQNLFSQLMIISFLSILIGMILIYSFYPNDIFQHFVVLGIWSLGFIFNSFLILILRIKNSYKTIGWYFLLFPFLVSVTVLCGFFLFRMEKTIVVSISLMLSEVLLLIFLYRRMKRNYFNVKKLSLISFNNSKKEIVQVLKSCSLILAVYLIDITDKTFSYDIEEGYTTVLIYGAIIPLIIRQAFDFKSVFYHKLQHSNSIKEDLYIFNKTLKWIIYMISPIVIFSYIASSFIKIEYVREVAKITEDHFNDTIDVFLLYILILPVYMIWDMMYRIYYKNDFLNKLVLMTFVGVFVNYALNYTFVKIFFMKASGIALSTLIVLSSYCLYSFLLLKRKVVITA